MKSRMPSNQKKSLRNRNTTKVLNDSLIQNDSLSINSSNSQNGDRIMNNVPYPATNKLTIDEIFDENDRPKIDIIKRHFFNEGRLCNEAAKKIITTAKKIIREDKNVLRIEQPVRIFGDIHGQFYDLLYALELGGNPHKDKYLFLGDYVDRGHFSMEVLLYLYSLKILYPNNYYLLRGNHECRHLTEYFTFKKECLIKYSLEIYQECTSSFDALPLAAIVNDQFLCVHGGISPEMTQVENIQRLNRFQETQQRGLMCDLLWSDPHPNYDLLISGENFVDNRTRGCSYYYTFNSISRFLSDSGLLSVIRAHEAQDAGFRTYKPTESNKFPSLITIFSAPNYLDVYNNKGAIIVYENNILNAKQFSRSDHPYWLPNFMDVFTWSLPFIAEKTTEMLHAILNHLEDSDEQFERETIIKQKILAIGRLASIFKEIRSENEAVIQLNGITPPDMSERSPLSVVMNPKLGKNRRRSSLDEAKRLLGNNFTTENLQLSFSQAKELDKVNEQLPQISTKKSNSLKKSLEKAFKF